MAHSHEHNHEHSHEVNPKTIRYLFIAFSINMLLTVVELVAGFLAGSIALVGDALHNTSDAFSILIAIIAYKIGTKKATNRYSYGFKRAETIGGFVNLILLFISGCYLLFEGVSKIITPEEINGWAIIIVSILALIIDSATAKLSHTDSGHNTNMKMLFLHNLADALGSVGVIVSGLFVVFLGWSFVDGVIAVMIAIYMIVQSVLSFSGIVDILMDAAPQQLDTEEIKSALKKLSGVRDVAHMHLWSINENELGFDCHIIGDNTQVAQDVQKVLSKKFGIHHCTVQVDKDKACVKCSLS